MILSSLSSILVVEVRSSLSSRVLIHSGNCARFEIVSWNDLDMKFEIYLT